MIHSPEKTFLERVAVVIPTYKCKRHILKVIERIGDSVEFIFVVDDKCPEQTGDFVELHCRDPRVRVLRHAENQGVGGAVISGFMQAKAEGATIFVKIDGDGQMDPGLIPLFIAPILNGEADSTKGNRFHDIEGVRQMPAIRIIGNAALSFLTKLSSGYWDVFDPTNGYIAIHVAAVDALALDKLARRYFFESDLLFRLNLARAVVVDVPMTSVYGDEVSNLKISRIIHEFAFRHLVNFTKRIFYNYYLRNFSVASLELLFGAALLAFGVVFGALGWWRSVSSGINASTGTIMLSALPILIGIQFLLNFLNFDMSSVPRRPIRLSLLKRSARAAELNHLKSKRQETPCNAHPQ